MFWKVSITRHSELREVTIGNIKVLIPSEWIGHLWLQMWVWFTIIFHCFSNPSSTISSGVSVCHNDILSTVWKPVTREKKKEIFKVPPFH